VALLSSPAVEVAADCPLENDLLSSHRIGLFRESHSSARIVAQLS